MKYLFLWGFLCVNLESKIGIPPVFDHWATKLYWKHRSLLEFHHCKENQTHKHMSYHPTRGISPIHALIPPTSFSNLTKISFRNPVSVISQKCSGYRTLTLFLPPWLVTSSSQPRRWGEGSHGSDFTCQKGRETRIGREVIDIVTLPGDPGVVTTEDYLSFP